VLIPTVFGSHEDAKSVYKEDPAVNTKQAKTLGVAYQLKLPNTTTAVNYNKQGKLVANLSKSTNEDPLGPGRSADISTEGSVKLVLGKNEITGTSLDLNCLGGTKFSFDEDKEGNSLTLNLKKAMKLNIGNESSVVDGLAVEENIYGNVKTTITGNREIEVIGNQTVTVHGLLEVKMLGKKLDNMIGDQSENFGGDLNKAVIGKKSEVVGQGRTVTVMAPDKLGFADNKVLTAGNKNLLMTLGNKTDTLAAGNYIDNIAVGNRISNVGTGNSVISVGTGNVVIGTAAGNVTIGAVGGLVSISSTTAVSIQAPSVNVGPGTVVLGPAPPLGGVVIGGPASPARDYVTGLPYIPSLLVFGS